MYLQENTLLQGGKYRIVRYISRGGFGCTYEAVNTTMRNRRVAIKELLVSDFCNRDPRTGGVTVLTQSKQPLFDKLRTKFLDEAEAIMDLNHTGIVRVTDFFEENGTAYYVMDYIDGQSLRDKVEASGELSEADALRYIRQVADALQYIHTNNRLHLDIKPANIMIDGKDKAILIDFGVSKQYDEASGENTSTLMGYTKGYAPVEQSNNSISKFLPATDIYALGATLYNLLSGAVPPPATELASGEELPPLPARVSTSTRQAVLSAMTINKHDRPQSVADFLALLDGKEDDVATNIIGEEDNYDEGVICGTEIEIKDNTKTRSNFTWLLTVLVGVVIVVWAVMGLHRCESPHAEEAPAEVYSSSGYINGHEWVDLGLSVKWATCNVGASSASDYGSYYAWGETTTKTEYNYGECATWQKNLGDISGDSRYDAARKNWGGSWRMPTRSECQELINNCTWTWTTQGGHNGYRVTGKNGNSIFLPAAGWYYGSSPSCRGEVGTCWSSTPLESLTENAYSFNFGSSYHGVGWGNCSDGRTVRPVCD